MTKPAPDGRRQHPGAAYDPTGRRDRRRLGVATAASLAVHVLVLLALVWMPHKPMETFQPDVVDVSIIAAPAPAPAAAKAEPKPARAKVRAAKAKPVKAKTPPRKTVRPPRPAPSPLAAAPAPAAAPAMPELSDAQIASATTAGAGTGLTAGGRPCNMIQWLQNALRNDPEVRNALSAAHRGKPTMVWNGEWIRSPGEEGEGLAVVRQAMMVHIAFAPPACRADPVRGLVLLSISDAPGAPRVALGAGAWRWSDLLGVR